MGVRGFEEPDGVAVASDGDVSVLDWYNHRIHKFHPEGAFVGSWGPKGTVGGKFKAP